MIDDVWGSLGFGLYTDREGWFLLLPVVSDWDEHVRKADQLCRLIDWYLDEEARGRGLADRKAIQPWQLYSEQRVRMMA